MSKKHKRVCATRNYTETFSAFNALLDIPITSSPTGLKICGITAGSK